MGGWGGKGYAELFVYSAPLTGMWVSVGASLPSFPVEDSACGDRQKAPGEAATESGGLLAKAAQERPGEEGDCGRRGGGEYTAAGILSRLQVRPCRARAKRCPLRTLQRVLPNHEQILLCRLRKVMVV